MKRFRIFASPSPCAIIAFAFSIVQTFALAAQSQQSPSSEPPEETGATTVEASRKEEQLALARFLVGRAHQLKGRKNTVYARELSQRAHDTAVAVTGDESYEAGLFLAELGTIDAQLRNLDKAISELERARSIMQRDPEMYFRRNLVAVESNLAWSYRHQKRYEIAEQTYRKILAEYESKSRTKEPEYAITLVSIGNLYLDVGRAETALECFRNARNSLKGSLPDNHPYVGAWAAGLGRYHVAKKDFAAAEADFRRALGIMTDNENVPYSKYAEVMYDYFKFLSHQNRLEEAQQLWEQKSAPIVQCLGEEHPTVEEIRDCLGSNEGD